VLELNDLRIFHGECACIGTEFAIHCVQCQINVRFGKSKSSHYDSSRTKEVKELAMKKLLIAGVMGTILMVTAGTQMASAATWRGGFRGHSYGHPAYRTAFEHRGYARPYAGYGYGSAWGYNRCW
jgi:hypothetical protein